MGPAGSYFCRGVWRRTACLATLISDEILFNNMLPNTLATMNIFLDFKIYNIPNNGILCGNIKIQVTKAIFAMMKK